MTKPKPGSTRRANGALRALVERGAASTTDNCIVVAGWKRRPYLTMGGRNGVRMPAARAAWLLAHGDPGELHVLHTCHNDMCVNVRHLYLGTHKRNMRDMIEVGRRHQPYLPGETNPSVVLTEAQVREIRRRAAAGATYRGLAREYPVSRMTIRRIVRREAWAHLD